MVLDWLDRQLDNAEFSDVEKELLEIAAQQGCSPTLQGAIARLIRFIETAEALRGPIARTARSSLSEDSQRCQVALDKLLLVLLGLDAGNHEYLKSRLEQML